MNKVIWHSENGASRSFDAMDDEHLANISLHIKHYNTRYDNNIQLQLEEEIYKRKLSKEFLDKAPYPWKDKTTGEWYIWSFTENHNVKISGLVPEKKIPRKYAKWHGATGDCFTKDKLYEVFNEYPSGIFSIIDDTGMTFSTGWAGLFKEVYQ